MKDGIVADFNCELNEKETENLYEHYMSNIDLKRIDNIEKKMKIPDNIDRNKVRNCIKIAILIDDNRKNFRVEEILKLTPDDLKNEIRISFRGSEKWK